MIQNSKQLNSEKTCPHLGFINDERTAMAYPSGQNFCHQCMPPNTPSLSHQREFCLAATYGECPVFLAEPHQPMPKELLLEKPHGLNRHTKTLFWLLLAAVIVFFAALVWFTRPAWAAGIFAAAAQAPAAEMTQAGATAAATQPAATATPTPTATTAPTLTPTPFPPHLLETPVALEMKLVVHQLMDGENLIALAAAYGTTVEAIKAINSSTATLWVNTLVIIPVGQTDVSASPRLKAILFNEEGTTLREVAEQNSVDIATLCQINLLPENYTFHKGEWVLIPAVQETPNA